MLLSVFSNVFKISVYKENTNLAIYWADRVYDSGNLSFCNNSFLENANSLVFICGIDVWNVSNEIFRSIGNGSFVLCPSSGCWMYWHMPVDILQFRMGGETKVYGWKAWLIALLGKMFLFIIILLVRRIFGKSAVETLSKREWIKFLVFPIFTIFMIAWMLVVVQSSQAGSGKIPIVLAFSLVGLNVFIYGLLYDILQKEVRTREYMVSMAKQREKYNYIKSRRLLYMITRIRCSVSEHC